MAKTKVRRIRIVRIPYGEAPEWVRREWVGLELWVEDDPRDVFEQKLGQEAIGVLSGSHDQENSGGYSVGYEEALLILSQKSHRAAQWFRQNTKPISFLFGKQFCEVVK